MTKKIEFRPTQSVPKGARVLAALSGGVDSAVATALLVEAGYEVIAISMLLAGAVDGKQSGCCSIDDFQDARRVSNRLGIPYYVLNLKEAFQTRVVDVFTRDYKNGRTPNPCLLCNRDLKFDLLWQRAKELDANYVATGHYAQIMVDDTDGSAQLLRGTDRHKDQSYFLFTLNQSQLKRTFFPVGHLTKEQVREKARELELGVAEKPESQDICFVPNGNYARFVERNSETFEIVPGKIVDRDGRVMGTHNGIHRFTIGQRRGLGLGGLTEPHYVTKIDAANHQVTVGTKSQLKVRGLRASNVHWVKGGQKDEITIAAKIRYRHDPVIATVQPGGSREAEIWFDESCGGVAPGQAVVFYDGDIVLGGGWIEGPLI